MRTFFSKFLTVVHLRIIRVVRRKLMLFMVYFFPEYAYFFSLRGMPKPSERIKWTQNALDDFEIIDSASDDITIFKSVNIVIPGLSFDKRKLQELKGPTFLVNWSKKELGNNYIYISADQGVVSDFQTKGLSPIWYVGHMFMDKNNSWKGSQIAIDRFPNLKEVFSNPLNKKIFFHYKGNIEALPVASAQASILAVLKFSMEVKIFGWDQYLSFKRKDFIEASDFKKLFALESFVGPHYCALDVVEKNIFGWYYAYRFNKLDSVKNYGLLRELKKETRLLKCLERIIYIERVRSEDY